jgi:geranylgeranyl pyrophosphate synthase
MEQVERLLQEILSQVEDPLATKLRFALGDGKRLRPALVILSGELFGPANLPLYRLAVAVEMLHTATLIHDDVVDGATLRRGRATLHTTWPAGAAVLAGDYLLAQAGALVAELEQPHILKIFAHTLRTMCAGEIRQMFGRQDTPGKRQAYYQTIEAKTASLCAASTEMAGMLAGATQPQIAALRRFGHELGIAFQIADDVLDFTGDEALLGKPPGSDLRQGVVTLPVLEYLEIAADPAPVTAVLAGQRDADRIQAAIEAVRSSGAIETALAQAQAHARQSQEALASLPDNAARRTLHALADYVVRRRR